MTDKDKKYDFSEIIQKNIKNKEKIRKQKQKNNSKVKKLYNLKKED